MGTNRKCHFNTDTERRVTGVTYRCLLRASQSSEEEQKKKGEMTERAGDTGSGGTGTDPSSCSRTFCSPVSLRYWMKCLRAVCLDSNSRNRTSKQEDAESEQRPADPGPGSRGLHSPLLSVLFR